MIPMFVFQPAGGQGLRLRGRAVSRAAVMRTMIRWMTGYAAGYPRLDPAHSTCKQRVTTISTALSRVHAYSKGLLLIECAQ